MFPILFAAKALSKMSSFGKSLDGKPVKNTTTEASAEKDAETAASATTNAVMQNVSNTTDTDKPEKEKEMFGGMDLGKIKSALDEDSPIGMPSEVKGGVYKQIFEVNKMMLGSLQRIESTMKLLLGLEYERAVGFQQQERDENLTEGDTDDKGGEEGPGRFRRGLSAAGSMLGGAYSKAKGFASGSLAKLLGLGVLIFAFNKYREEIIGAMAGILEYFNDVVDVFKSEGLGAAFNKVVDDFKTIFFPKIQEISLNILDFIWGAIKGVAVTWLYGAQGDARISQETGDVGTAMTNLSDTSTDAGKAIASLKKSGQLDTDLQVGSQNLGLEKPQRKALLAEMKELGSSLATISKQSGGRIQFTGLGDLSKNVNADMIGVVYPVSTLLNTKPIIDGVISEFSDLENIKLNERAGITRGMTEEKQNMITDALYQKSLLAKQYYSEENREIGDSFSLVDMVSPEKFDKRKENALKDIQTKINAQDLILKNSGQIFTPKSTPLAFDNYGKLNGIEITGTNRSSAPSADFNPVTVNNVDNKKIIDAKKIENNDLKANNSNPSVMQLARFNNLVATSGI